MIPALRRFWDSLRREDPVVDATVSTTTVERAASVPDDMERDLAVRVVEAAERLSPTVDDDVGEALLAALAEGAAGLTAAEPFDPEVDSADAALRERDREDAARHADLREAADESRQRLLAARRHRAGLGREPESPMPPLAVGLVGSVVIGLAFTVTFFEALFRPMKSVLRLGELQLLTLAAIAGLGMAGLLVIMPLLSAGRRGADSLLSDLAWPTVGFIATGALLLMRSDVPAGQVTPAAVFASLSPLSLGLAGVELAGVLGVEMYAHVLRREWSRHHARSDAWDIATAAVQVELDDFTAWSTERDMVEDRRLSMQADLGRRQNAALRAARFGAWLRALAHTVLHSTRSRVLGLDERFTPAVTVIPGEDLFGEDDLEEFDLAGR